MYQLSNNADGVVYTVVRLEDQLIMTLGDHNNSNEYKKYLEWLAEGNTPTPADES